MPGYPAPLTTVGHVEPVPRRIRATSAGRVVLDTTDALYVWEQPYYPTYCIPVDDVDSAVVHLGRLRQEPTAVAGTVSFDWDAMDAWFEEDEQVYVHPRSPYVRVDALRSARAVRVEIEGMVLAEAQSCVMVFETGLPTRYYLDRTALRLEHLTPSATETACPYKGRTSGYWSAEIGARTYPDIAWTYAFPTRQLLPIAGLVAFYNEKVDTYLDGVLLESS